MIDTAYGLPKSGGKVVETTFRFHASTTTSRKTAEWPFGLTA